MNVIKLNQSGFDHVLLAVFCTCAVALIGTFLLVNSHAYTVHWKGVLEEGAASSGFCLSTNGNTTGSTVALDPCGSISSSAQKWSLNYTQHAAVLGTTNAQEFTLQSSSGTTECLNDPAGSKTNGVALQLTTCSSTNPTNLWVWGGEITTKHFGYHQLINVASSLCIDDAYGSHAASTKVQLWHCSSTGPANQSWYEHAATGSGGGGSGPTSTGTACSSPKFQASQQTSTWNYATNETVNNNVWGPSGTSWSQRLNACSPASWNVVANFKADGGAIQTYPDSEFSLSGKTVTQYSSLETCYGESGPSPAGGEWDYAYDMWLNNFGIEVMVWNNWTDTTIYPPSNARAVTIDGIGYHEFKGGGTNEWIYTRDTPATSGCFNALNVFKDLVAHPSTSGITSSSIPNAIEYGVEIASTNGSETFQITNATLTPK